MNQLGISPATLKTLGKVAELEFVSKYYLAGGTACALHYGHRLSFDLDFFSQTPTTPENIRNQLIEIGNLKIIQNEKGTFNGILDQTKLSFFIYPYPLISPSQTFHVQVASVKDLACMKLESISSRGAKRDFIDLYYICLEHTLTTCIGWFKEKFQKQNVSLAHVIKSLVYFTDADLEPMPQMHTNIQWDEIKNYYLSQLPDLVAEQGLTL
jgi:predicted nucleotidyltransferase component of viral defense system